MMPYDPDRLRAIVQQTRLLNEEANDILLSKRVRLKHKINGHTRTGSICWVSAGPRFISVGIEVDRLDGRPGVLVDTHYTKLEHVEVVL